MKRFRYWFVALAVIAVAPLAFGEWDSGGVWKKAINSISGKIEIKTDIDGDGSTEVVINEDAAITIGATGSISEETNTMTFDDGDGDPITLQQIRAASAGGDDMGAVNTLAELNSTITDATLLDDGAIAGSTAIGLTAGDTYTNFGAASDDSLNEMFAAIDTALGTVGGGFTNLTDFDTQTAWRLFYSDANGDVTELALGSDGEYLKSNGAALAPSWATPSGAAHDAVTLAADADVLLGLSTQAIGLDNQNANVIFAGPASGAAADPTFRAMVVADLPTTGSWDISGMTMTFGLTTSDLPTTGTLDWSGLTLTFPAFKNGATSAGFLTFYEDSDNGTDYISIVGPASLAANDSIQTTSYGWELLESANEAGLKSLINLEIGTDVQAYDADLTTWAGITPGANVGTFLATPSSANLLAATSDETGSSSGSPLLVFNQGPAINGATLTGAIDGGGATSVEIPNSDDPDVDAAGEISWDTDGWMRAFDGTNQVAIARKIEAIHVTVIAPNDLADAQRDAFMFWSNESGMSFIVTGWKGWAGTDDTTLNIEEADADGVSNNATVDAVELATGSGPYTGSDTTITGATIENGHVLLLDFDDTDTPTYVKMTIYGYYNADVN